MVYIVLGVLYESYIHPLTILSGLPSACLGALLTLYLFKGELNIYSFVGLIILVGIVKKNAIMQIDFALQAERNGAVSSEEAIYPGLYHPVPADHDDHGRRHAGLDSGGPGRRRRRRGAPSAGTDGDGRPGRVANHDLVSHSGGVHLHGAIRQTASSAGK